MEELVSCRNELDEKFEDEKALRESAEVTLADANDTILDLRAANDELRENHDALESRIELYEEVLDTYAKQTMALAA